MEKIVFDNGVHDISNADYHSSAGVSRSGLWNLTKTPMHFFYEVLDPAKEDKEDGIALLRGEIVHTMVLEPDTFSQRFVPVPSHINKRTKLGKAEFEEFMILNQDKKIIDEELIAECVKIANRVRDLDESYGLFKDAIVERSIFFTHEPTGMQCKVKPDAWLGGIITDLKTTTDASPRGFMSSAYKYGYYLQAAMIKEALASIGETMEEFIFFCIETNAPYVAGIYQVSEEALLYGKSIFDNLMNTLKKCFSGERGFSEDYGIQTLGIPAWATFDDFGD